MTEIEIETKEHVQHQYAVVGKKRGKLVWFCGERRRTEYNKSVWSYGDGWACVVHKLPAVKKVLKAAKDHEESTNVRQISIAKLTTHTTHSAEVIPAD